MVYLMGELISVFDPKPLCTAGWYNTALLLVK
jgi:hypothetical protein